MISTTVPPRTRRLEQPRDVLPVLVRRASVRDVGPRHVVLDAVAAEPVGDNLGGPAFAWERQTAREPRATAAGTIRVDVVSDDVLRFRYAEADVARDGAADLVVGAPPEPTACTIDTTDTAVVITTAALVVTIELEPYRVAVADRDGRPIAGIGGREKNNFWPHDSYATGLVRLDDGEPPVGVECFDLTAGECVYGLGERFLKLDKTGQTIDLDMADGLGPTSPRAYKNVPFWVSTAGYGVFLNTTARVTVWAGSRSATEVGVAVDDDCLDYYLFTGSVRHILDRYTDVTGKPALPPRWSFGYWQSKLTYTSADEMLRVVEDLRAASVPIDVVHCDTGWFGRDWVCDFRFSDERFPDVPGWTAKLRAMGVRVSLWQLPYVRKDSSVFGDFLAIDGFVKDADGDVLDIAAEDVVSDEAVLGIIDFTNPRAAALYADLIRGLLRQGVSVIKTDFGEAAPSTGHYFDGTPGRLAHNAYPLHYNRVAFQTTQQETGDGVVWARAAWAGGQRYPVHWGGDNTPDVRTLPAQLVGGLSLGLSGFAFWSQDIGGFNAPTSDEVLQRWFPLSMFTSHIRIHGNGDRELTAFSPETLELCREYLQLRYRLLPYILSTAVDCSRRGLPVMRAMVVDFQDDPSTWHLADQWMLGDALLVAPVFTGDRRRVYLPAGTWTDWWTGQAVDGGRWHQAELRDDRVPLFVREGALVTCGPDQLHVDEKPHGPYEVLVAPFESDGTTTATLWLPDRTVTVIYTSAQGRHEVHVDGDVDVSIRSLRPADVTLTRAR